MGWKIEAACGCHIGKIRKNNEDNFFFAGEYLDSDNMGLEAPLNYKGHLRRGLTLAVFDGMGGENFGEVASYTAASEMQRIKRKLKEYFSSKKFFLLRLVDQLNSAVVRAKKELCTDRMGTTMVGLHFGLRRVYISNIGDSRAYRLRDNELVQLSQDHVLKIPGKEGKKTPLTQHLGIDPEDMQIEPYIVKHKLLAGDMYLLCSDGLTDMLTNYEISCLMRDAVNVEECVKRLVRAALDKGGRDNITVIVCRING